MNVIGVNNPFHDGFKTRITDRINAWLHWGKDPVSGQVKGSSREATTIILLDEHSIKPTPNDWSLYAQMSAALQPHQRSFIWQ